MEVNGLPNNRGSMLGFAIGGYILYLASALLFPSFDLIEDTAWLIGLSIVNLAGVVLMFVFLNSFSKACNSLNDNTASNFFVIAISSLIFYIFVILYYISGKNPAFLITGLIPALFVTVSTVLVGIKLKKRYTGLLQTVGKRIMSVFWVSIAASAAIIAIPIIYLLIVSLTYTFFNSDYLILVYLLKIIFGIWLFILNIKLFLSMDELMTNGYNRMKPAGQTPHTVSFQTVSAAPYEEAPPTQIGNYAKVPPTRIYSPSTNSNHNIWRYLVVGGIGVATGLLIWFCVEKFNSANKGGTMGYDEAAYNADPTDEYLRSLCVLTDDRIQDVILNNKCTSSYNIVERLFKSANELQLGGRSFAISKRNPMKSFIVENEEGNMALVKVNYTDMNSSREAQYNVILKKQKITTDGKTEYVWDIDNFEGHPEVMRSKAERARYVNAVYSQIMSAGGPEAYWDSYYDYDNYGYARDEYIEKAENFIGSLRKSFPSGVVK